MSYDIKPKLDSEPRLHSSSLLVLFQIRQFRLKLQIRINVTLVSGLIVLFVKCKMVKNNQSPGQRLQMYLFVLFL